MSKGCVSPAAIWDGSAVAGETRGKVEKSAPRADSGAFQETAGKIITAGKINRGGDLRGLFIERRHPGEGSGAGGGAERG